jgi:mono/diheme cytochrome c family protein
MSFIRHPFWQAIFVLAIAYALIKVGIPYLPPVLGVASAPVPGTVVLQYVLTVTVGILVWVSSDEARWKLFKEPIQAVMVQPEKRGVRSLFLVAIPAIIAFGAYDTVRPKVAAPASLRSIHPAPPAQITFRGETMLLNGLENPIHEEMDPEAAYEMGKAIYYENCMPCHGDFLDAQGHYAHGFNPAPLELRGGGTIAQLTESFVFWRIAKGGPGLPREGGPWNSAMPVWEDFLTAEEIWAVTSFLYEQAGVSPRTWEEEG